MPSPNANAIFGVFLSPSQELDDGTIIPSRPLGPDEPRIQFSCHPSRREYTLTAPVIFRDPTGKIWRSEKGSKFDGATIPRFFWRWARPEEHDLLGAAAIHDDLCAHLRDPSKSVQCSSEAAAMVFWLMIRASGVRPSKAWCMWAAVRFFGPQFDGPHVWGTSL